MDAVVIVKVSLICVIVATLVSGHKLKTGLNKLAILLSGHKLKPGLNKLAILLHIHVHHLHCHTLYSFVSQLIKKDMLIVICSFLVVETNNFFYKHWQIAINMHISKN